MNRITIATMLVTVAAANANAEIAPKSKKKLQDQSTHIAIGTVSMIYTNTTADRKLLKTAGVIEILVSSLEKGEGIRPGAAIYARFWTQRWNQKGKRSRE